MTWPGTSRKQTAGRKAQAGEGKPSQAWLEALKVVAMPLVALLVGFIFNSSLNQRQQKDADNRVYIDMMGRREDAESSLRKDMFKSILDTFMRKEDKMSRTEQIDQEILCLELLACNFHEALDMGPLFRQVQQRIPDGKADEERRKRLERVARQVCDRQISALTEDSAVPSADVDLDAVKRDQGLLLDWLPHKVARKDPKLSQRLCLSMSDADGAQHYRQFQVEALGFEEKTQEVQVWLQATRPLDKAQCENPEINFDEKREIDINFSAGLFDFPMIDNTRLSLDQRCAVAVTNMTKDLARLRLVYFPGTRASLKDKRFFDDILRGMRNGMTSSSSGKR